VKKNHSFLLNLRKNGLARGEKLGFPLFHSELRAARFTIAASFGSSQRSYIRKLQDRVFVGEPASAAVRAGYGTPERGEVSIRPIHHFKVKSLDGYMKLRKFFA
jgi:hypothetical protein